MTTADTQGVPSADTVPSNTASDVSLSKSEARGAASGHAPVLSVRNLVKHFPIRSKGLTRRRVGDVHAVCDVSFDIYPNETLCIVGESGCGKTTTGRLVLNLVEATTGQVSYQGKELTSLSFGPVVDADPLARERGVTPQARELDRFEDAVL